MKKNKGKFPTIMQILDLMEQLHKDKDWLVEILKMQNGTRSKRSMTASMTTPELLDGCPYSTLGKVLTILKTGGLDPEKSTPLVRSFNWFYTDIVSSANPNLATEEQVRRIILLNKLVAESDVFRKRDQKNMLALPTGDGMVIGFADSPEPALLLALEVNKNLHAYNRSKGNTEDKSYIRIGLESGPVFLLNDVNGQLNAWGQGLIMARRIMDLGDNMHILASDKFVNDLQRLRPQYQNIMHLVGYYTVKHDEKALVYNIHGEGFGNKLPPKTKQSLESFAEADTTITTKRFLFSSIEVVLDIIDVDSMFTHHSMIWEMINITKNPAERVFYSLEGDAPRSFSNLNVVVTDEKGLRQDIMSLTEDEPYKKEFFVKLLRPMNPTEKGRRLRIDYDWEETKRQYLYKFSSKCDRFRFQLTAPKPLEIRQRVVKVDLNTGDKFYASTPAQVKYLGDKTIMTWSGTDFTVFDAFRFDW